MLWPTDRRRRRRPPRRDASRLNRSVRRSEAGGGDAPMSPLSPTVGCGGGRKRKAAAPEMTSGAALDVRTANDRERERMRVQSRAFARLRTMLPWVPADTKLSKLHTLRLAVDYIRYLAEVLDEADGETTMVASPAHNSRMKVRLSDAVWPHWAGYTGSVLE